MCLIMLREPNVVLDKEKFTTAVLNNSDGWGVSIPDMEGGLTTLKGLVTDTDELYDMLHGEFAGDKMMIHLRYTTAGSTVIRNSHPFPVLEEQADGVDMRVCHNGTLPKWAPKANTSGSWESDTRRFVRGFVRPLMKRLIKGEESKTILNDTFVESLLDQQLTAMSVLTFIDGYGNTSIVNQEGNGGFMDTDGTYFSNKYSHDPTHRLPASTSHGSVYQMGKKTGTTTSGTTVTPKAGTAAVNKVPSTFSSKFEIDNVEDLHLMSDDTIQILTEDSPEDAALLIKELLRDNYSSSRAIKSMSLKLKLRDRRIKTLEDKLKEKTEETTNG